MLLGFLSWFMTFPFLLVAIVFALSNRETVLMSFWPFDAEISIPLSLLTLGLLILGVGLGSFFTWVRMLKYRFAAKKLLREVEELKKKLAAPELRPQPVFQQITAPAATRPHSWKRWLGGKNLPQP